MTAGLVVGGLFGLGLWLVITSLPWAQRRPDLAFELPRLSAPGWVELEAYRRGAAPSMFLFLLRAQSTRSALDDLGLVVCRWLPRRC